MGEIWNAEDGNTDVCLVTREPAASLMKTICIHLQDCQVGNVLRRFAPRIVLLCQGLSIEIFLTSRTLGDSSLFIDENSRNIIVYCLGFWSKALNSVCDVCVFMPERPNEKSTISCLLWITAGYECRLHLEQCYAYTYVSRLLNSSSKHFLYCPYLPPSSPTTPYPTPQIKKN